MATPESGSIQEFLHFIASPKSALPKVYNLRERFLSLSRLFFLKLAFSFVLAILINLLTPAENSARQEAQALYSPLKLLFIGAIFLPFMEESVFRLGLIFKPLNFGISLLVTSYFVLSRFYFDMGLLSTDFILIRITLALSFGLTGCMIAHGFSDKFTYFWTSYFRYIFYLSVIGFAAIHLLNYDLSEQSLVLAPVLILPQVVGGLFLGFIRVKFGFLYCMGFHAFNNFLGIGFSLLGS